MTQFNQELITKARKGEIAILNDGSVEELQNVMKEVWDKNHKYATWRDKYYYLNQFKDWQALKLTNLPAHSVKDFFMPDTNKLNLSPQKQFSDIVEQEANQPRTYRVTRQQMKEIWEALPEGEMKRRAFMAMMANFPLFTDEYELPEMDLIEIFQMFDPSVPDFLKLTFKEYFFIPDGEPVLARDNLGSWVIGVSDGKGKAYVTFNYNHAQSYGQIIPFTKNPPK